MLVTAKCEDLLSQQNMDSNQSDRPNSCPKLDVNNIESDCIAQPLVSSSLPSSLENINSTSQEESNRSTITGSNAANLKLVQNCSPDCMITQKIVDKLLSRMLQLENERTELLAANRSWAIQFEMMKERHRSQVKRLQSRLDEAEREKEAISAAANQKPQASLPANWLETRDQVNLLTQQAEIYREDFLEERKARAKAHAQIESLRNELKREKRSKAKLTEYIEKNKSYNEPAQVLG